MNKLCKVCNWEKENRQEVDHSLGIRGVCDLVGCGRSSYYRHLEHSVKLGINPALDANAVADNITGTYRWELGSEDFVGNSPATPEAPTDNDVEKFLRERGLNPDEWDYTFRFSEWEQGSKTGTKVLNAFRVSGRRKIAREAPKWAETYIDTIKGFTPATIDPVTSDESLIIVPTDFQIGKVDLYGGSGDTVEQVLNSFSKAAEYAKLHKPKEICIVEAGDIVENIFNVSSQLGTNDLGLPHQVAVAFELMLAGLQMLAPLAPKIKYIAVPSNHGAHRIGPKSPAGNSHEDWGIVLATILRSAAKVSPALEHLEVIMPELHIESLSFETCGTTIGVTHGHQASSPDRIGDWWAKQTHGNMPVARARILITGHWHSFRVQQSGDARWIFVGPTSDRGSSWFMNKTGEQSQSGMLAFRTTNNTWSDIQIL